MPVYIKLNNKAIVTLMALLFLFSFSIQASDTAPQSASIRFTLPDKHDGPQDKSISGFDCLDKIYAVTELNSFKKGKYHVEFRWIDPNGGTRERTEYDFHMSNEPTTKLWAWLELSRAQGAAMIQWLNPAAGLEEFIGEWQLELLLNGKTLNTGHFDINC